jgi:hypothetical protein
MSKASEWAKLQELADEKNRPQFKQGESVIAEVDNDGTLTIHGWGSSGDIPRGQETALARWILDTFGDDDAKPPR